MPERAIPEGYIDTYAAAGELGVSRATLWKLLQARDIERFRVPGNRRTLIRRSDLEALREPILLPRARPGRPRGSGGKRRQGKAIEQRAALPGERDSEGA